MQYVVVGQGITCSLRTHAKLRERPSNGRCLLSTSEEEIQAACPAPSRGIQQQRTQRCLVALKGCVAARLRSRAAQKKVRQLPRSERVLPSKSGICSQVLPRSLPGLKRSLTEARRDLQSRAEFNDSTVMPLALSDEGQRIDGDAKCSPGNIFLNAAVRNQPHDRDRDIQRIGSPRIRECQRNRDGVEQHGQLVLELMAERLRQRRGFAMQRNQGANEDVVG